MKTQLTIEQSKHLIELGVPKEKASIPLDYIDVIYPNIFIFTLIDLLEILPKEIYIFDTPYYLNMVKTPKYSECFYACCNIRYIIEGFNKSDELIDALYKLFIWAFENNYISWKN